MSPLRADFVAEVFCPSECVRLIQDQASMRNVDSRIHLLRFDCCVFLFYSFSAVTFATQSAHRDIEPAQCFVRSWQKLTLHHVELCEAIELHLAAQSP